VLNVEPPASQVPRIADGTLVRPGQLAVPSIRGVTWPVGGTATAIPDFNYLGWHVGYSLLDFGPQYRPEDESGIATLLPPVKGAAYAIMVPQLDATGNTRAGIRGVEVQAPLGTSFEFNYVATPGIRDLANLAGSFIPFHKTEAARIAAGDTRPSLESLYGNQAGYVAAVRAAANRLVSQRFLLQRDADRLIQEASNQAVLP
jgi:Alpha/beta hydrolase domain